MSGIIPDPVARELAAEIASLRAEVDQLRRGARATQLSNSSVENGRITINDALGLPRTYLGKQPDGTFGLGHANGYPPSRPNTPLMTPGRASIHLGWNGELVDPIPGDFSHLNMYLSDAGPTFIHGPTNLVGTLSRAGTFPVGPLTYDQQYWARYVAVNLSGKESEPSFTAGPVTPSRLLGSELFPESITETEIAPDSIDTPHLKANAVTALKILAEEIDAYHLKAGIIDADKLAAILVLANDIVAGDPVAARMVMNATGITQYTGDSLNSIAMRLGADPAGGNYFTVVSPEDGTALAAISPDGTMTASAFSVTGRTTVGGIDLVEWMESRPRGAVARAYAAGNSPTVNNLAKAKWMETSFIQEQGRMYRIETLNARARVGAIGMSLRYTDDGTAPTVDSPAVAQYGLCAASMTANTVGYLGTDTADGLLVRVLLMVENFQSGAAAYFEPWGVNGMQMVVEDIGPLPSYSGGSSGGAQTQIATKTYPAWWSKSWNSISTPYPHQGKHPDRATHDGTQIGFDDAAIRADLVGATINRIDMYLYCNYAYYPDGVTVVVGTHDQPIPAGAGSGSHFGYPTEQYPFDQVVSEDRARMRMKRGEGRWIPLPLAIGNELRDGVASGLVLDASQVPDDPDHLIFYGAFDSANPNVGGGHRPSLRITYTKGS